MRHLLPVVLAFFLLCFAATVSAQDNPWNRPPNPLGPYGYDETLPDLLNIKGLTYHKARPIIMGAGWSPEQTLQEGTEDHKMAAEHGNGLIFWNKGYHELQTCSGTGASYCAFLFQNKKGDWLRVVTKYEEWEDGSTFAKVEGYWFNP